MKRAITALLLMLLPVQALASDCDHWTAGMEDAEEGRQMTARICTGDGDAESELSLTCSGTAWLAIRYLPAPPMTKTIPDSYETKVEYRLDQEKFSLDARFEEMDLALASAVAIDAPMVEGLTHQAALQVSDVKGKIPSVQFTLKGSKAALSRLIATCPKK